MLNFSHVSMRNFLTVGNGPQAVDLDKDGLTLVLGENLDAGGVNSRNGVGKTTILQAISFGLFGQPLSNVKKDNLVNSINAKNMTVSIEFTRDGNTYKIERGRKPAFLRYHVNDGLVNDEGTDESQGDSRNTQIEIEKVLGFSHEMFRHIIALNTYTDPFLKLKPGDQRVLIEELLGISAISTRSDILKELVKSTKDSIKEEEFRIKAVQESNATIQNAINDLKLKHKTWDVDRNTRLQSALESFQGLSEVDIDAELKAHVDLQDFKELRSQISQMRMDVRRKDSDIATKTALFEQVVNQLASVIEHKCHTCGTELHDEKHTQLLNDLTRRSEKLEEEILDLNMTVEDIKAALKELTDALQSIGDEPQVLYDNMDDARQHKNTLEQLADTIAREEQSENPFQYQIDHLSQSGIQEVSYDNLNEMQTLLKHQDFLLKLLTSKDSFIRKKIIDQNINHLNHRLNFYLEKLNLPHEVTFKSDLSVEINLLGRDFDFEQLSRGEMNRVILSTSWAFRDVWESLNFPVNLMFVDEMLDSGIDAQGSEAALEILKRTARDRNKNIFLISHKEELLSRVAKILYVKKENNFTRFEAPDSATE
jgi:DNA repair exonuclease SbcCD ATPase subunit